MLLGLKFFRVSSGHNTVVTSLLSLNVIQCTCEQFVKNPKSAWMHLSNLCKRWKREKELTTFYTQFWTRKCKTSTKFYICRGERGDAETLWTKVNVGLMVIKFLLIHVLCSFLVNVILLYRIMLFKYAVKSIHLLCSIHGVSTLQLKAHEHTKVGRMSTWMQH